VINKVDAPRRPVNTAPEDALIGYFVFRARPLSGQTQSRCSAGRSHISAAHGSLVWLSHGLRHVFAALGVDAPGNQQRLLRPVPAQRLEYRVGEQILCLDLGQVAGDEGLIVGPEPVGDLADLALGDQQPNTDGLPLASACSFDRRS
jgi:hypothetical protein